MLSWGRVGGGDLYCTSEVGNLICFGGYPMDISMVRP